MYRTALALAVSALALAALFAGCGGGGGDSAAGAASGDPNPPSERGETATVVPPPSSGPVGPAGAAAPPACGNQTARLLGTLDALRDRLVAGLDYRGYVGQMRRARAAYDALPVSRLGVECLTAVGGPAEAALNEYIDALNVWADCVAVPGCQSTSIEARLQRKWRLASRALSEAERALNR